MIEYDVTFIIEMDGVNAQNAAERTKAMILEEPECVWTWIVKPARGRDGETETIEA